MHTKTAGKLKYVFCAAGALLWVAAFLLMPFKVFAQNHTFTVICSISDDEILSDMQWKIYRVGERSGNSFSLVGDFADYPVSLNKLSTSSGIQDAAYTIENYAVLDKITPLKSGKTDKNGIVQFDSLENGLYLFSGEVKTIGNIKYIPSPVLVEISDDSDNTLDLTSYPKIKKRSVLKDEATNYTVEKVWSGDDAEVRPEKVVLEIYCDGEFDREVTLDDSNDWKFSWISELDAQWRIKEIEVPDDYTVIYRDNETTFTAQNTYEDSENPTEPSSDTPSSSVTTSVTTSGSSTVSTSSSSSKLPQTGQLWWPVPVMMAGGTVMVAVGNRLGRRK